MHAYTNRCYFCKRQVPYSLAITLQCGQVYHAECINDTIKRTPSWYLPSCRCSFNGGYSHPLSFPDLHRLVGKPKLEDMMLLLSGRDNSHIMASKYVHCSNPACSAEPRLYSPIYDTHQMLKCW